jgi:hypothetical protein
VLPARPQQPDMGRRVLVQHHAHHRATRTLLAMRRAPRRLHHQASALQMHLRHRVAQLVAVPLHQLLVKVLHREVRVTASVQIQHPRNLRHARPPRRALPQPAVSQAHRTLITQAIAPAPKRPFADPKQLRRLDLAQPAALLAIQQPLKPHLSYALVYPRPVHRCPLVGAGLKPDTSRAT